MTSSSANLASFSRSAFARADSPLRFFPPPETFRGNIVSVRLAAMFLLVSAEFLGCGSRRRVQLPIPLTPTWEALIVLLDRLCSPDESGLQFTPNRANHDRIATIVARVSESVQQAVICPTTQ